MIPRAGSSPGLSGRCAAGPAGLAHVCGDDPQGACCRAAFGRRSPPQPCAAAGSPARSSPTTRWSPGGPAGSEAAHFIAQASNNTIPVPSLQALVKFAAGASPAARGRALAKGQAQQAEVVASAAGGQWVRVRFTGPGASTAKAAKRIEEDSSVELVEVCAERCCKAPVMERAKGAPACGRHARLFGVARSTGNSLWALPAAATAHLFQTSQPAAALPSLLLCGACPSHTRGARAPPRLLQRHPLLPSTLPQPNFIYTHQLVSNDPAFTSNSLWGMYGDSSTPANAFGCRAAEAWAAGFVGRDDIYIGA